MLQAFGQKKVDDAATPIVHVEQRTSSKLPGVSGPQAAPGGLALHEADDKSDLLTTDEEDRSALASKADMSAEHPDSQGRSKSHWQRALGLVLSVPSYWWVALALFMVLETLAVVGSVYFARSEQANQISAATDVGKAAVIALEKLLDDQKAPILSVANLITLDPHWPTFNASFINFSMAIYENYHYYEIEACPYGVVHAMSFPWHNATGEELYQFKLDFDYQVDLLSPNRSDWQVDIESISQDKSILLLGPWYGDGPLSSGAFVLRYSIFLPSDTISSWDMPPSSISSCPWQVCHTPGNTSTWWGWANSVFVWDDIKAGLAPLDSHGLLYTLAPIVRNAEDTNFIATSDPLPQTSTSICLDVDVFGWSWPLCFDDPSGRGWWPSWFAGLIVGVTALSLLISTMCLLVLRSRSQAMILLKQQVRTNSELAAAKEVAESGKRALEEEKYRMQALMARQYQLIALFDNGRGHAKLTESFRSDASVDTRERIEELRQTLNRNNAASTMGAVTAEICLMELLGEGSFGKVYRGTWRGTEVAIKTMVLPSYMSGNEKREKMLIMETAISSVLQHPNIVQTFTYSIQNIVENSSEVKDTSASPVQDGIVVGVAEPDSGGNSQSLYQSTGPGSLAGTGMKAAVRAAAAPAQLSLGHSTKSLAPGSAAPAPAPAPAPARRAGAIHGFEVRLVLEYCDKGCLRDALTHHAFLGSLGLNYKGILDTALDVTRAMMHLHMADVLHGDLKARNVMLKSSGTEGRGLVAKVADFGLACKIDTTMQTHMSNLFQGTLTHMAPELLLHGRMSKAADVYAFGILLWELFTAGEPFEGVPQALLGHKVIHEQKRPNFPIRPPEDFGQLINECWAPDPLDRPGFETILLRLTAMRDNLPGPTVPLVAYTVPTPHSAAVKKVADTDTQPAFSVIANQAYVCTPSSKVLTGVSFLNTMMALAPVAEEEGLTSEEGHAGKDRVT